MEKLYFKDKTFLLKVRKIPVKVTPRLKVGCRNILDKEYKLPDSAYGEWLFLEENYPRYYFCIFKEDGTEYDIANYLEEANISAEKFIVAMLIKNGLGKVSPNRRNPFSIFFEKKSKIEKIEVIQIIEDK